MPELSVYSDEEILESAGLATPAPKDLSVFSDEEVLEAAGLVESRRQPAVVGVEALSDEEVLQAAGISPPSTGIVERGVETGKELARGVADIAVGVPEGAGRLVAGAAKFVPALATGAGELAQEVMARGRITETGLSNAGREFNRIMAAGQAAPLTEFGATIEKVGASPFEAYNSVAIPTAEKALTAVGFEGSEEDLRLSAEYLAGVSLLGLPKVVRAGRKGLKQAVAETREAIAKEKPVEPSVRPEVFAEPEVVAEAPATTRAPVPPRTPVRPVEPEIALENLKADIEIVKEIKPPPPKVGLPDTIKIPPDEPFFGGVSEVPSKLSNAPTLDLEFGDVSGEFYESLWVDKGGGFRSLEYNNKRGGWVQQLEAPTGEISIRGIDSNGNPYFELESSDITFKNFEAAFDPLRQRREAKRLEAPIAPEAPKAAAKVNDIRTWVKNKGGIDFNRESLKGELNLLREEPGGRFLVNKQGRGRTLDQLALEAKEEGFLRPGEEATPSNMLQAIQEGRKTTEFLEEQVLRAPQAREARRTFTQSDFVGAREGLEGKVPAAEPAIEPGSIFDVEGRKRLKAQAEAAEAQEAFREGSLEQVGQEIARTSDEFIEEYVPPVGLSTKIVSEAPAGMPTLIVPEGARLKSVSSKAQARKDAARGIKSQPFREKAKGWLDQIAKLKRHFPELDPKKDGAITEVLRQNEAIPSAANTETFGVLQGITSRMTADHFRIFEENILLADLMRDIDRGKYAEGKPLPFEYKNRSEVAADLDNFRRIAEANEPISSALAERTRYMDALKKDLVDAKVLDEGVLEYDSYFHHQVLAHMESKRKGITSASGVRPRWRAWQKERTGSAKDYNTSYLESEFEVVSQSLEKLKRERTLQRLEAITDRKAEFKSRAKLEGAADWREFMPEDYVEWQPVEGSVWYKSHAIPEQILDQVTKGLKEFDVADVKEVVARGGRRRTLAIPERVAKQLDALGRVKETSVASQISKGITSRWKQWTLFMPLRVIKYSLNNLSGDFDIAFAYDPTIMSKRNVTESFRELKDFIGAKRAPSRDIVEATQKGVLSSGFTFSEIPEITRSGLFKVLEGGKQAEGFINKYWRNVKDFNEFRENFLRLASYKHFKRKLDAPEGKRLYGASPRAEMDALYENPNIGNADIAAKLSRELIGDYGNISQAGVWLREHMLPFYSWMEINAPRYVRLFKNLPHEGKGRAALGAAGAKKVAIKGSVLTAKAAALYGAINVWNNTMFPEAERELSDQQRRQLHMIFGRREDGSIISIRFQGALSDALSWFGAEDLPTDVAEVASGEADISDKAEDALRAPVNKLINATRPILKTVGEVATGRALYPDAFNPRPIRDPAEHIARTFSVDMIYRLATGKPTRGFSNEAMKVLFYETDPGEAAYYSAKKLEYDYLDDVGVETPGFIPSKRANAAYYYKQALKFGDEKAAIKFKDEYAGLGGTSAGLRQSVNLSAPLGRFPRKHRRGFQESLSAEDKVIIQRGKKWYNETFRKQRRTQ